MDSPVSHAAAVRRVGRWGGVRSEVAGSGRHALGRSDRLGRLRHRLQARRAEIEEAVCRRAWEIDDPLEAGDPDYADGLRAAVSAALDCGFAVIEEGAEPSLPVPPALLTQAGLAARSHVSLDTVLRRYLGGYALFADFLTQEAETPPVWGGRS